MKNNLFGASLLRTFLGAAALLSSTAFAHAANPFVAGSHWTGFRVSAVGGGSSSAVLDVDSPNASTGKLKMLGLNIPVSISCTLTGVVDMQGQGANYTGIKVHGTVALQGGTYSLSSNYVINNVPGLHNDQGRLSLLRSYKTVKGGPLLVGTAPGTGLLPPGPCIGPFGSSSGFEGRLLFLHDIPTKTGEADPPGEFTGDVYMQDLHFRVVGTINPVANQDGTHSIELLGENVVLKSSMPMFKSYGMLVPAVRTNPMNIFGNYELIGLLRNGDAGRFLIGQ